MLMRMRARTSLVGWVGLLALLVPAAACTSPVSADDVVGNGVPAERAVDVINFDRIDFAGIGTVTAGPGLEGATVRADENIIDLVAVEVRNRVLFISMPENTSIDPVVPIEIDVQFADLASVEMSGAGTLVVTDWSADIAEAVLSGAGDVVVAIDANELNVDYPGAGSVTITGTVVTQRLDKDGLGPYTATDLRSQFAELTARGVGDIDVWVTAELFYNVTGVGELRYWGEPTLEGRISSQGGLIGLGPRA